MSTPLPTTLSRPPLDPVPAPASVPEATADVLASRLAPTRSTSLVSTWGTFLASRLLVWLAGCAGAVVFGVAAGDDRTGISSSFGQVGNLLTAPAVRWDAIWYLQIAQHGYQQAREAAFFPLYPAAMRVASWLTGSLVSAGLLISFAGCLAGLVILRRLAELELGPRVGRATVQLLAFSPVAFYLSAVYTEGLFLALSTGTLYAARRGRWWLAGVLGGLAAVTRVTGVVLLVPVVLMFFYGPRGDRPDPVDAGWRPRYRFTPAVLWSALIPIAFLAFAGYLSLRGFGVAGSVTAQQHYSGHRFVVPLVGAWQGLIAGSHQFTLALAGQAQSGLAKQALFQLGALTLSLLALGATLRRLPIAYGAYVLAGLLLVLSTPTSWDPLRGLARYATVLIPLWIGVAAWAVDRGAVRRLTIGSAVLLCLLTAQFATWHMVGTPAL